MEKLLLEGRTCEDTAKLVSVRKQTVVSVRQQLESEGKLEMGSWKREVSNLLGDFVQKASARLANNVDQIPIGQLPMAIAISIDKVRDLSDAPTVRVETRLKISQDDLNKIFSLDNDATSVINIDTVNNKNDEQQTNDPVQPDAPRASDS